MGLVVLGLSACNTETLVDLNNPDLITGPVVRDSANTEQLYNGVLFEFARNNVVLTGERNGIVGDFTQSELAGATYSPDGDWLFFNAQSPGITFAVTGPWKKGAL